MVPLPLTEAIILETWDYIGEESFVAADCRVDHLD